MPDENGSSRLDRIEAALERLSGGHEEFQNDHRMLLKSYVLAQERMEKFELKLAEIGDKLNGVIRKIDQLTARPADFGRKARPEP
ncbi:MAG: hypothetical protein ACRD96_15675 [Bryobacteraceae bacterium]